MEKEGMNEIGELLGEEERSKNQIQRKWKKLNFAVLDENKDGFIYAKELRNELFSLGLEDEASENDCKTMIKGFDDNFDGLIDFNEFIKVLGTSFCCSN